MIGRAWVAAVIVGAWAAAWPGAALGHGGDVFVQAATLTGGSGRSTGPIPPSGDPSETFGTSVAVSANGKVLAVGAPGAAEVYVYVRPANGRWKTAHQTIALYGYDNSDLLGTSVAVSADGSTIVAGAPSDNGGAGAVYVYVEPQGGWKNALVLPTMMLRAQDSTGNDDLGASVAVSANGSTIIAGAPGWNGGEGAIYLFTRVHNDWRKTDPVAGRWANVGEAAANSVYGGNFGQSVAMSGDGNTIVVGAPGEYGWEGGVYVFRRSHGAYGGYHELHDSASGTSDQYFTCSTSSDYGIGNPELGTTVAVSRNGRTIAAGEPCAGTGGQAVVYTEPRGGWFTASSNFTAGLTPLAPDAAYTQQLGYFVALSGDGKTVIAADPRFTNGYGSYVAWFGEPKRGWAHVNPPLAANFGSVSGPTAFATGIEDTTVGDPVAIGSIGGTIFVGGVGKHNEGAVYVFNATTTGATPTELICTPAKLAVGATSTCTVTVSDPRTGGPVPRGRVTFTSNGGTSAQFNHKSCQLKVRPGKVSASDCSVKFIPSRPLGYTIAARYGGDTHHLPDIDATVVRTSRSSTSTTVSCTPSSVKVGVTSVCSAITSQIGFEHLTIMFKVKAGGTLSMERCRAGRTTELCTVGFSATTPGSYSVAAEYPGDPGDEPSSGHTAVTVTS